MNADDDIKTVRVADSEGPMRLDRYLAGLSDLNLSLGMQLPEELSTPGPA